MSNYIKKFNTALASFVSSFAFTIKRQAHFDKLPKVDPEMSYSSINALCTAGLKVVAIEL